MAESLKHRILVVDDSSLNLEITRAILEDEHLLATAGDGDQALDLLPTFRPDLVLLDIMMPGLDGYEVCRTIRADRRYAFVKIILLSARSSLEERLKGYQAGADDYITKPFRSEELEAKIKVFLRLKRAEETDQIKNRIMTLFSHETRTPLNGILAMAELLSLDESLSEESREYVDAIAGCGRQLQTMVEKCSLLAKLKGAVSLQRRSVQIDNLLKQVVNESNVAELIVSKGLQVKVHIEESIVVDGDWAYLQQVLELLIANAVQHTPEGLEISLSARRVGKLCEMRVADQGPGVPVERLHEIFDEFSMTDPMHHSEGTGLSLAICRAIVTLHGGEIDAENNPDRGATFLVRLQCSG
jgi:two-component system sensor histidine kinase/response regulator